MSRRLGIHLMVWSGQIGPTELDLLPTLKDMGYAGVELPIFAAEGLDVATIRAALDASGLACTTSTALPPGTSLIDPDLQARGVAWLQAVVKQTAALGATLLCGPMALPVGERRGRGYTQAEWDRCVASLRAVGATAADLGVTLAFEVLNRFETFFLNTVADGVRLVEAVDSPAVGLLLDTFHMNIEEKSTPQAILEAGRHLKHFHASENDRGTVGTGQVPWREVFGALQEIGYDGWIVVESFNAVIPELAGATCVWRPLAESPDILAYRSERFLRPYV